MKYMQGRKRMGENPDILGVIQITFCRRPESGESALFAYFINRVILVPPQFNLA